MSKNKTSSRSFGQRRHRRNWLTFLRMCRYGVNNFTRNAWLTVAATAVMTITLLIVFATVVAQNVLADTTQTVGKRIERSIYLKTGTTREQAKPIIDELRALSNVEAVEFTSSEQGRQEFAEQNKSSVGTLSALNEATNVIPAKVGITLTDVNDTAELVNYVKTSKTLEQYITPDRQPTFMSERKSATDTIAGWTLVAQQAGIALSIVFVSISVLIIFNTIRMAIFNRKEEIQMMKLIGADRSFIRGPFIVEAVVYGVIAAIIATILGVSLLMSSASQLEGWVESTNTIKFLTNYIAVVLLGMILLGALIGTISSLLATRRYLKI